jgi:hypothetical protein
MKNGKNETGCLCRYSVLGMDRSPSFGMVESHLYSTFEPDIRADHQSASGKSDTKLRRRLYRHGRGSGVRDSGRDCSILNGVVTGFRAFIVGIRGLDGSPLIADAPRYTSPACVVFVVCCESLEVRRHGCLSYRSYSIGNSLVGIGRSRRRSREGHPGIIMQLTLLLPCSLVPSPLGGGKGAFGAF